MRCHSRHIRITKVGAIAWSRKSADVMKESDRLAKHVVAKGGIERD